MAKNEGGARMDQLKYFQLILRIVGLLICLDGLDYLREFVLIQTGYITLERTSPTLYFANAGVYIIVGLYLFEVPRISCGSRSREMRSKTTRTATIKSAHKLGLDQLQYCFRSPF
jgi:hypothetical protein